MHTSNTTHTSEQDDGAQAWLSRWKLVPRVALLAFTILAETVNISQRSSSNEATAGPATITMSVAFLVGIALMLVALPAAFFRAKLQDGRQRLQLRKVPNINANTKCLYYAIRSALERPCRTA